MEFHNNQPGKPKVTFEGSQEEYKDNGRIQCRELPLCAGSGEGCQWQALSSPVQCEETATRTRDLGVLFFDGETFRLERLHRAVKGLRHVRVPGESAAVNLAATTTGMGAESQSPPLPKVSKSQTVSKPAVHSVPVSSVTTFIMP